MKYERLTKECDSKEEAYNKCYFDYKHWKDKANEYKHRAEVAERALFTACVNLIKDEEDNVNMELLAHVVYTKYLRKSKKRTRGGEERMKYQRITERRETPLTMLMWAGDSKSLKMYNKFIAEVRKQVVKDCLQVLHNLRVEYVYDDYSWGWNEAVDAAIKQFNEKYAVSVRRWKND